MRQVRILLLAATFICLLGLSGCAKKQESTVDSLTMKIDIGMAKLQAQRIIDDSPYFIERKDAHTWFVWETDDEAERVVLGTPYVHVHFDDKDFVDVCEASEV